MDGLAGEQRPGASAAISAEASFGSMRIGRATTRPASARASAQTSSAATAPAGRPARGRGTPRAGVISSARSILSLRGDLLEQVVAANEVLGALVAELGRRPA